jgi:hypothetical protein
LLSLHPSRHFQSVRTIVLGLTAQLHGAGVDTLPRPTTAQQVNRSAQAVTVSQAKPVQEPLSFWAKLRTYCTQRNVIIVGATAIALLLCIQYRNAPRTALAISPEEKAVRDLIAQIKPRMTQQDAKPLTLQFARLIGKVADKALQKRLRSEFNHTWISTGPHPGPLQKRPFNFARELRLN